MNSPQYFAQNAFLSSAIFDVLLEKIKMWPNLHWAALIDGAFDYSGSADVPYITAGLNCYAFNSYEGLENAAPWLMPFDLDLTGQVQLKKILRHCRGRPMLSFIASREPIAAIVEEWSGLHWVNTLDDQKMLMRFADTRILPILCQTLSPDQLAAFTRHIEVWSYINREGQLKDAPLPPPGICAARYIHLSQDQLNLLMQLSEPDAVIDLIAEGMPEIIPRNFKKAEFYELVATACKLGQRYGVTEFPDTVSLSVSACLSNGMSSSDPALLRILASKDWVSGKLGDAILAQEII